MENMFDNYTSVILRDEMLEGLVGVGYIGTEDYIWNGLGKCSGHDNIGLAGVVMEYLSHKRDQKVKK